MRYIYNHWTHNTQFSMILDIYYLKNSWAIYMEKNTDQRMMCKLNMFKNIPNKYLY